MNQNGKFIVVSVMFYGGLALCAAGIEGVAFYAGIGLGLALHGASFAFLE